MKSSQILREIIKYLDENAVVIKKVKRMVLGQIVKLKGKTGKVLAFAFLDGRLLVWLEIEIWSRYKVLSNGILSPLTIHRGVIF